MGVIRKTIRFLQECKVGSKGGETSWGKKKEFEAAVKCAAKGEVLVQRNVQAGKLTRETRVPCRENLGKGFSKGALQDALQEGML